MLNHNFNTPLTGDRLLARKKNEASDEMDALKHAKQIGYKDHTKAILGIRHAETIEQIEAIVKPYAINLAA